MAYKKHSMSSQIDVDPKGAADEIVLLYDRSRANQKVLARKLGVSEQTLIRWIKILEASRTHIVERMDKVKAKTAEKGLPTRPAHGWRRKSAEEKAGA